MIFLCPKKCEDSSKNLSAIRKSPEFLKDLFNNVGVTQNKHSYLSKKIKLLKKI